MTRTLTAALVAVLALAAAAPAVAGENAVVESRARTERALAEARERGTQNPIAALVALLAGRDDRRTSAE